MPCPVRAETATLPGWSLTSRGPPRRRLVGLVEHQQLGHPVGADLGQHGAHGVDLALRVGGAGVDDVDEQVGLGDHLERALERLDQPVGQLADEADRVGQEHGLAAGQREAAGGGVERGEEPVLDEHAGVGEPVEQRALAGVRVARRCSRWPGRCACGSCAGAGGSAAGPPARARAG